MPGTARLSKKFYDRLGEDIANELVDWFNAVDSTYQTQLRTLNETNSRRFLADVRGEIGTLCSDMAVEIATVRSDLLAELATVRADLRAELASVRADLIKWMFTFGIATVISLGGLIVALEKVFK